MLDFAENQGAFVDFKIQNSIQITEGLDNRDSNNRGSTVYTFIFIYSMLMCVLYSSVRCVLVCRQVCVCVCVCVYVCVCIITIISTSHDHHNTYCDITGDVGCIGEELGLTEELHTDRNNT